VPDLDEQLRARVAEFVAQLRRLDLKKSPSIAETLDWARALVALGIRELEPEAVRRTLAVLLKHEEDLRKAEPKVAALKRRLVEPEEALRPGTNENAVYAVSVRARPTVASERRGVAPGRART
jgi:hypothetical protein